MLNFKFKCSIYYSLAHLVFIVQYVVVYLLLVLLDFIQIQQEVHLVLFAQKDIVVKLHPLDQ